MKLRESTTKDIQKIVFYYLEVFSAEPWNETLESGQIQRYVKDIMEMNTFIGYIAEDEVSHDLLGIALGYVKPWYKGKEYLLDTFLIVKNQQSKGMGSQFLTLIKKDLLFREIPAIMLDTDKGMPSEKFYTKNGFDGSEESVIMFSSTEVK